MSSSAPTASFCANTDIPATVGCSTSHKPGSVSKWSSTQRWRRRTRELLAQAKVAASRAEIPPPLRASPKCHGCSLHGICLPDEVNLLCDTQSADAPIRRLVPASDDATPLYVEEQGARVGLRGEVLEVRGRDGSALGEARLFELSHLVLFGNVQCRRRRFASCAAARFPSAG